ncbi:hypothetical protein LU276_06565 [Moraxella haemolytica]|uniref:hypothetical protein n=1 Tax=Moraxella TaxID=475 RepID=UPI00254324F9|nr:hypothetical protein [Moraxella sp. ZY171148]WII94687.1 hypothetical protein LU276_06565 [Moraxella sp. ZY171148]
MKNHHNHRPPQTPKRGQIWSPKDAAHHDVIIADTAPDRVYLQYVDSPEFTFTMDKSTFLKYYTFHRHHRHIPLPNTIYNEPFFA